MEIQVEPVVLVVFAIVFLAIRALLYGREFFVRVNRSGIEIDLPANDEEPPPEEPDSPSGADERGAA